MAQLPEHFPPHQTAYRWFTRYRDDGTWENLNHHLVSWIANVSAANPAPGGDYRQPERQNHGSRWISGYDASKKINGRKREAMVDTDGRGLILQVHAASVQDRDGAIPLLQASRALYPFIERVFADSAYAADRVATATKIIVEIVRKQAGQIGFAVHPRRWVVERFLAWLGRNRRLANSKERSSRQQPSSMPLPSCCSHDDLLVRFKIQVELLSATTQPHNVILQGAECLLYYRLMSKYSL